MKPGTLVRYTHPAEGEHDVRLIVIEDRGDRVAVALVCDLPFPPVEVLPVDEITPVDESGG